MDLQALTWAVLVAGALFAGACFVGVLVVPARGEALTAILGLASFGTSSYALVEITASYARVDAVLYAFAFMTAAVVGGWALTTTALSKLAGPETPLQQLSGETAAIDGVAVVLAACVEPATYEARETATMLECLTEEGLIEPSLSALPFMFFGQKARYRALGGTSPARGQLATVAELLEAPLARVGVTSVKWATCNGDGRLGARVLEAVRAGYRRIVVAELAVGEPLQLSAAIREVDALRLETQGVTVSYTGPLAVSDQIAASVVTRILTAADEPDSTGVVLVGHGQPEERAQRNPAFDENEMAFLNRVRMLLVEKGLAENNVRIAWADWNKPDVTSAVRHLAALGCRRVVVSPAVFPVDSMVIRLDIEISVRQARVEEGVIVVTLPAWRDDHSVSAELVRLISEEIGRNEA